MIVFFSSQQGARTWPRAGPGNAPVTDYILWAKDPDDTDIIQYYTPVPVNPCPTVTATLTGLKPGTNYQLLVRARNLVGRMSAWSNTLSATTDAMQVSGGSGGGPDPEPTDPLTASFEQVPSEHNGKGTFDVLVRLSETVGNFSRSPRASSFEVTRGRVRRVEQADAGLWRVRVKPNSWRDVGVTLAGGRDCDTAGAVCTPDGRALQNTVSATVQGPAGLAVANARAREGRDETMDFSVQLTRAVSGTVTVDYAPRTRRRRPARTTRRRRGR